MDLAEVVVEEVCNRRCSCLRSKSAGLKLEVRGPCFLRVRLFAQKRSKVCCLFDDFRNS